MVMRIIRRPKLVDILGKCRSATYLDEQAGLLTRPIRIGERSVGWPESEIQAIAAARIAAWSNEQIRELVKQLEADRKLAMRHLVEGLEAKRNTAA